MNCSLTQDTNKAQTWQWLPHVGSDRALCAPLVVMLVLLSQCAPLTHRQETVPNRPATRTYRMKSDVVKEAVERVLEKRKFVLDMDKTTLLHIQTEWLLDIQHRSMVRADINPLSRNRTKLTVHISIEKKHATKKVWQPMDEIGIDVYNAFLDDVELENYRVIYYRE